MNHTLARLTVLIVSAPLHLAKSLGKIDDYFVDIETHGLFKKIRLEQDGNEYEYRLEVPGGLLVLVSLVGSKDHLNSSILAQ